MCSDASNALPCRTARFFSWWVLVVCCHSSGKRFLLRNGDGVKEGLHRRLAETPAILMWRRLVVAFDTFIEIRVRPVDQARYRALPASHNKSYFLEDGSECETLCAVSRYPLQEVELHKTYVDHAIGLVSRSYIVTHLATAGEPLILQQEEELADVALANRLFRSRSRHLRGVRNGFSQFRGGPFIRNPCRNRFFYVCPPCER